MRGSPDDDGRRYVLTGPDTDRNDASPTTVQGSAELARRLAEANRNGAGVAFRRIEADTSPTDR